VTKIRSLLAGLFALTLFLAPLAHADSNGVPPIAGTWSGKVTSVYWDQTSDGSLKPKLKYKSKVTVTIAQTNDAVTLTVNFADPFPMNSGVSVSSVVLNGFGGNFHLSATMDADPAVALSGAANRKGTSLSLSGVAASTEFTHELKMTLKKQHD
jgi:hypothetical protein